MATTILPSPTEQGAKPATKPPRCKGCGAPWLPGHACLTPPSPPTTDRRVHQAGATRLYEKHANSEGQWVFRLTYRCGCVRLGCTRSEDAMLDERAKALESLCSTHAFAARRDALDEEQTRG